MFYTMNTHNPLCLPESKEKKINRSGRPPMIKVINFGPQPKSSIIVQILQERKLIKDETKNNIVNYNEQPEDPLEVDDSEDCYNSTCLSHRKHPDSETDSCGSHKPLVQPDNQTQDLLISSCICKPLDEQSIQPKRSMVPKEHEKHLTKHKQYNCNYPNCTYSCKISSNLTKHKRVHTNEKPYLCDKCSFRSNFINSLKVHKRIHTTERPFHCANCSYKCNSSSNLKKHLKHRHPDTSS